MASCQKSWATKSILIKCLDWAEEDTELPSGNLHLWEESWDDDEQNDDFSKQLKYVYNISGDDVVTDRSEERS
jgi:hypothetical protein